MVDALGAFPTGFLQVSFILKSLILRILIVSEALQTQLCNICSTELHSEQWQVKIIPASLARVLKSTMKQLACCSRINSQLQHSYRTCPSETCQTTIHTCRHSWQLIAKGRCLRACCATHPPSAMPKHTPQYVNWNALENTGKVPIHKIKLYGSLSCREGDLLRKPYKPLCRKEKCTERHVT